MEDSPVWCAGCDLSDGVRGVPDEVWLSCRTKTGAERLAAGPDALSSLPAIEGRNSDIVLRWYRIMEALSVIVVVDVLACLVIQAGS